MPFREDSLWNEKTELMAFLIFKKLETDNFPRSKQAELCRGMMSKTGLDTGNISAKMSNYKSVAGYNKSSNASSQTKYNYKEYNQLSIDKLSKMIVDFSHDRHR
jgi:hypothetical protein